MNKKTDNAAYSVLLLAVDDQIFPFEPLEWKPTCNVSTSTKSTSTNRLSFAHTKLQQQWSVIPSPSRVQTIKDNAVNLFRENQSQHGTNVLVRIDLQHNPSTDSYTSTSIDRLPDFASATPSLVAASIPGGEFACARLLRTLKPRRLSEPAELPTTTKTTTTTTASPLQLLTHS